MSRAYLIVGMGRIYVNWRKKMNKKTKVVKHLKGDIKTFKKEISEDKKLIKTLKPKTKSAKKKRT